MRDLFLDFRLLGLLPLSPILFGIFLDDFLQWIGVAEFNMGDGNLKSTIYNLQCTILSSAISMYYLLYNGDKVLRYDDSVVQIEKWFYLKR